MERHRLRLPFAVVATVAAAAAATFALRPRTSLIEPVAVEPTAYFSGAQLERAEAYRGPQRALGVAGIAVSGGALALIALRPPRPLRRALERAGRQPLAGGAAVGAGLSVAVAMVTLPLDAVAHARAVDVGLSTQGFGAWLGDVAKAGAVGAALAGAGSAIALLVLRRFPRRPWIPGAAAAVAVSAAFVFLSPLLLAPIFNRFEPLQPGPLRSEVLDLARRAGVDVGEVLRVDASRRTTGTNAYVGGLGRTKRVVLYDTLIERFPPEQVRSVVAHELAHVRYRDLPHGLLWLAIVAPPAVFLAQVLAERFLRGVRPGESGLPATPAALPAYALALALVSFAAGLASNPLSRAVEARADAFALRLTHEPAAFIGLERSLAVTNVSEPDPPRAWHVLLGTHPTTVERIGFGLAFARASGR